MPALVVKNLVKTYVSQRGSLQALKGVDLEIEEGEFFSLLGPNGAGKSTLIGVLTGLVTKTSGTVSVFGYDLDRQNGLVKLQIGLVPQEFNFNIFETVLNTVLFQAGYYGLSRAAALKRAEPILNDLDLWDKRNEPGRTLSGGMKRRLMLARALVSQPRLLILDEPTAGVDIELRRSLWDFLRKLNAEGTTIILTTHYLEEAETLCRRVAIIDHGEILRNCPIRELLAESQVQTFVMDLVEPLSAPFELPPFTARLVDANTLEVDVLCTDTVNEVFECLDRAKVAVRSMRPKANRLEELFVRMTHKAAT